MRFALPAVLMFSLVSGTLLQGQDSVNFPVLGEILRYEPGFDALVGTDAKLEVITSGYVWTEGPCWVPARGDEPGYLLFSDIPPNSIYKWVEGVGAKLYMRPSGYTGVIEYGGEPGSNGLLLDPQGRLVCCEHGDRRISVVTENGGKRTLVDNFNGQRLNSPNDAVFHSSGDLYFTDPPYGLPNNFDDERRELDFCGVYRLGTDGVVTLLTTEMTRPNGIGFSPDEKTLYVAQSDPAAPIWKSFPVQEDGTLGKGKLFHDSSENFALELPGLPDGMAIDHQGNIFATGPGGVYVLSPAGKLLGRISTGERTSNCKFGGEDGSILFVTADTYVCKIQTKTHGIRR
jgi:gluconolactonase